MAPGGALPGAGPLPKSASAATDEIETLKHDDEFMRRLQDGDKTAKRRWDEFFVRAYPETDHE